jgi:uncharacterized protein (DUF885 family)
MNSKSKPSPFKICFAVFLMAQVAIPYCLPNRAHAQDMVDLDQSSSKMRALLERFATDRSALQRSYNIPMSPSRSGKMKQFYADWQNRLEQVKFEGLSQDGRIDYLLFKNLLEYQRRRIDRDERRISEVSEYLPGWKTIVGLEESRRNMETIDSKQAAGLLAELTEQLGQTKKKIKAGLTGQDNSNGVNSRKTHARRAAGMVRDLRNLLKRWFGFYNGYDPLFTWWVGDPYKELDQALEAFAAFLRKEVVGVAEDDNTGPVTGDPIGKEALMSELANEMIPYSPDELLEIGNKEYAWCEAEMIKASRELGYGDDWLRALEYVKTLHVAPGDQPNLIKEQALEAIEFVEEHDLLTIPQLARETWRMEMMSPERQRINPFFTGGEVIRVSFPTNTMAYEQKLMSMRGNNIHFSRATVHHELIPGHHLQGFMSSRYRTHRRIFRTPFWGEGWALYWEMLLWDYGFPQSPENRIGMLFWRMHRCARIIFSLSFHLEKMTAQECIDFLVNRVGHELDNATAEVRRSFETNYSPLYQCAYMLGGLQIRALHEELVKSGKMSNREFHDAVLKENSIPIEMVRASLTHQPLTENFEPRWKFYR